MHVVLLGYASKSTALCCSAKFTTCPSSQTRVEVCEHLQRVGSNKVLHQGRRVSDPPSGQRRRENYLAKDYFGATSQTEPKPPRLLFSDARAQPSLNFHKFPRFLFVKHFLLRHGSRPRQRIVSWWRQSSSGNYQENILKEFLPRH